MTQYPLTKRWVHRRLGQAIGWFKSRDANNAAAALDHLDPNYYGVHKMKAAFINHFISSARLRGYGIALYLDNRFVRVMLDFDKTYTWYLPENHVYGLVGPEPLGFEEYESEKTQPISQGLQQQIDLATLHYFLKRIGHQISYGKVIPLIESFKWDRRERDIPF